MYKCEICEKEFESKKSIGYHVSRAHQITADDYWDEVLPKQQCLCGCGEYTKIHKGERQQFISKHNIKVLAENKVGKSLSSETKEKIRKSNLGKKRSEETRKRISEAQKKVWTPEQRKRYGEIRRGENSPNWKGGRTKVLKSKEYNAPLSVIKKVRERDKHTCQMCGKSKEKNGRNLDVHHIVPYLDSKDNTLENLITLCRNCHGKADRMKLSREEILNYNR